jgi:hypothetical protein
MFLLFAALAAGAQPFPAPEFARLGRKAWVFSTIGHSEWCPPGNVKVDLSTGRYALTVRAPRSVCNDVNLERPVKLGMLSAEALDRVRAAAVQVAKEGTSTPDCHKGDGLSGIYVDNGGPPLVVLTTGGDVAWAPDDRGCWSGAVNALHSSLEGTFNTRNWK